MKLKKCSKCNKVKKESEFNWRNKKRGWRNSFCKECHSAYRRLHYLQNREKYIRKALKWNQTQTKILRRFIYHYLKEHPCVDCGEKDIRTLDFDHSGGKFKEICMMLKNCYSLAAVEKEIEKCVVRCANCHRKKTFLDRNYWKSKMGP